MMDKKSSRDDLGCTLEIEINEEAILELEDQGEIELDIEINNELDRLNQLESSAPYMEAPWVIDPKQSLVEQIAPHLKPFNAVNESIFCDFGYFAPNLYMTENFYRTTTQVFPLHHPFSKKSVLRLPSKTILKITILLLFLNRMQPSLKHGSINFIPKISI
ncbi:MAG: hypothetical protein HWD61_06285 [Parachlamydiaceae bacterium]|nr:MAG: hypothetical protein HWD61_06285 [Parachlamydiaceae bacterium]